MESVVILILLLKNANIKARSGAFYEENIKNSFSLYSLLD